MPDTFKNSAFVANSPSTLLPSSRETTSLRTIELFLGMVAHELRTQLAGIVQVSQYIQEGKNKEFYLRALNTASLGTLHVLNNMLTTVKINAGKLDITTETESFHFNTWVKSLIQPLEDTAIIQRRDICLTLHSSLEGAIIITDKVKLGQILQNLLTNALKFSYAGTCIAVKCHIQLAELTIQVINQGISIPPAKIDSLFKPYEQLDNGFAGTGLGLYLSQRYVQALGGTLTVKSDTGNTVFTVSLPVYR
jgi:signal transduction histidine kinase